LKQRVSKNPKNLNLATNHNLWLKFRTPLDSRQSLSRSLSDRSVDPDLSGMRGGHDVRCQPTVIPAKAGIQITFTLYYSLEDESKRPVGVCS
jgi:hypothetical protein